LVAGGKTATQAVPFQIRIGEVSTVLIKLVPGVRQRFQLTAPNLEPMPRGFPVQLHRDGQLFARSWLAARVGETVSGQFCLLPGDYVLTVIDESNVEHARTAFHVGDEEGPTLQLNWR
jgi:hypothetical protein